MPTALDALFVLLFHAKAPTEVEDLQERIWEYWLDSGVPVLNKHMEAGIRAIAAEQYTEAIAEFTAALELHPGWAEAWNKRATAYYLRGEYRASLLDIEQTLQREPRHFGALEGRSLILRMIGDDLGALRILQRLAHVCPNLPGLQVQMQELRDGLRESGH